MKTFERGQRSNSSTGKQSDSTTTPKVSGSTFLSGLERLCERVTQFVSGHWGTVTAVVVLLFGTVVFLGERHSDSFAATVERFMTMLSLALLFLLQRSQTKETLSLQVKLNEILKAHQETDNQVINVERLSEEQLKEVHDGYERHYAREDAGARSSDHKMQAPPT